MNTIKFNDYINSIGYSLPNSFNYSIGIGELIRKTLIKKPNTDLWLKNINNNIFVLVIGRQEKSTPM